MFHAGQLKKEKRQAQEATTGSLVINIAKVLISNAQNL